MLAEGSSSAVHGGRSAPVLRQLRSPEIRQPRHGPAHRPQRRRLQLPLPQEHPRRQVCQPRPSDASG